jgi:subtilisin-like proprotein convertase family protein
MLKVKTWGFYLAMFSIAACGETTFDEAEGARAAANAPDGEFTLAEGSDTFNVDLKGNVQEIWLELPYNFKTTSINSQGFAWGKGPLKINVTLEHNGEKFSFKADAPFTSYEGGTYQFPVYYIYTGTAKLHDSTVRTKPLAANGDWRLTEFNIWRGYDPPRSAALPMTGAKLKIATNHASTLQYKSLEDVKIAIKDKDHGNKYSYAESMITVPESGTIAKLLGINVPVKIIHNDPRDLKITLTHAGTQAVLMDVNQGDQNNLQEENYVFSRTFTTNDEPLQAFAGKEIQGDWTLVIEDGVDGLEGTLDEWVLNFKTN